MPAIELTQRGGTAVLTMNRPAQMNAIDQEMQDGFTAAIAALREDPSVKAVLLTGAGENFCSGADVKAIAQNSTHKQTIFALRHRVHRIHRWFDELLDLEKPLIAAVDGVAFGGGLSLALCADFVLASPRAKFCSVFARIGYVPDMGAMYLLPRAIGLAKAKDLVFTGRVVGVAEAKEIGLVHTICEHDLLDQAMAFARRFEHAPTDAIGMAKKIMNHVFETDRATVYEQEGMAQSICRESEFHAEAVRRFAAKEKPLYEWPKAKA